MPGYSDYQRVVNWDGPPFVEINATILLKGVRELGVFDVTRYGYVGGFIGGNFIEERGVAKYTLEWFTDEGATHKIGSKVIILNQNVFFGGQLHIPNQGPWLRITVEVTAAKVKQAIVIFPTNRASPVEFLPFSPVIFRESIVFGAAEAKAFNPEYLFAGPAQVLMKPTVATTAFMDVEAEVGIGEFVKVDQVLCNGGATVSQRIVLAPTSMRFTVTANAAMTVAVAITPYTSGSS